MFKLLEQLGWGHRTTLKEQIQESVGSLGGWLGWSNLILEPTPALIRAQLEFRIHVRAECGKNTFHDL